MSHLSGTQVHLSRGNQSATIASVGAALRVYSVGGSDVVVRFREDEVAPAFHGMVLAPWPNRLADGQYSFGGRDLQVAISEPARNTALHGLACWDDWAVVQATSDAVTLALNLPASPGYPFSLRVSVTYALSDDGLTVTTTALNTGTAPLPYGVGFHPWISPGAGSLDDCTLELGADSLVTVDDRLLPTGTTPVDGDMDFRHARTLADADLDDAFVDPTRDDDGRSWARLVRGDGSTVAIWMDGAAKAWQVCTGNHISPESARRSGVAIEPMSCIADAFRTGDDLVVLEHGERHTLAWGMALIEADASS
ncbi:aldose 1-epimerase family protein [Demequina sp. TTPB684]|uniref:aldose 1-epimerase family protein n=1 Tax=unclassified Demequina TaxID=2620311 RepID=UPI001CF20506|nr:MULTISPECIES: aldose 1-epimerase family protein [unclassified Demequina]MCB2412750.1 aldose 1-epimerase family protein [Demequina sp. TTPB684]UPU88873.1 aldose 1-epimerase family protein [Demequina sp. TMPB413]